MTPNRHSNADAVETLIRAAGARTQPPAGAADRVWPVAQAAWRQELRGRRRRRAAGWLAAAAAVVAGVTAIITLGPPTGARIEVARVDRFVGPLEVLAAGRGEWLPVTAGPGQWLNAGTRLRTGRDGHAGLRLSDEVSLRLAAASEVELTGRRDVRLLRGRVYVDTGPDGRGGRIRVVTDAGTAQDFGTQFEFGYIDGRLQLRVREGQVVIERGTERLVTNAGQQLTVDAAGRVERSDWSRGDPAWRWIETVAPAPPTDGQPVAVLLDWVARETGRTLRYANAGAEREAAETVLHGRLSGVAPLQSLDVMLATTGLAYTIGADQAIEVRTRTD